MRSSAQRLGNLKTQTCKAFRTGFLAVVIAMALNSALSPTAMASPLVISPSSGTSVSGSVTITVAVSSPVSWFNLMADGVWIASNPIKTAPSYSFIWNSSRVARGNHVISVVAYDRNNKQVATAAVTLKVLPLTYYVVAAGSDAHDGSSRATAWATVQKAASTMVAGDTVIVAAGTYAGVVRIAVSGTSAYPITFQADAGADAMVGGFQIQANYIRVIGFDISNHNLTAPDGYGIYLVGSNVYIASNYIHDLYFEGVMMSGDGDPNSARTSNNVLINNRFRHCEMAAAHIEGRNNLIEGNDVAGTVQYPAGGPVRPKADADALRFFGSGHIFRRNYIHDIYNGTSENPSAHIDCFLTWGPAANITIERNLCAWPAAANDDDNEVGMLQSISGPTTAVTFRNNVFVRMRQGVNVSGASAISVLNNTFVGILQEGVILMHAPSSQIINNIFYDVGSGEDSYVCADAASQTSLRVATNDLFVPAGSPGTYCGNAPHYTLDPMFVNAAGGNFRLQSNSPLIDLGTTLPQVTNDYDGVHRPQGPRYDIGAFEYHR